MSESIPSKEPLPITDLIAEEDSFAKKLDSLRVGKRGEFTAWGTFQPAKFVREDPEIRNNDKGIYVLYAYRSRGIINCYAPDLLAFDPRSYYLRKLEKVAGDVGVYKGVAELHTILSPLRVWIVKHEWKDHVIKNGYLKGTYKHPGQSLGSQVFSKIKVIEPDYEGTQVKVLDLSRWVTSGKQRHFQFDAVVFGPDNKPLTRAIESVDPDIVRSMK